MSEYCKRKLSEMEELSEEIILNKPWAERLMESVQKLTKKAVLNWCKIIIKIGEPDLDVDDYVNIFLEHVSNLYEDFITDIDAIEAKSLAEIMKLLDKMKNLCRELGVETPTFNCEELPLNEQKKLITHQVEQFETLAEIRRTEVNKLHQQQLTLCKRLGRETKFPSPESSLPLPAEVDALRSNIDALETEALEREEKFFQLREQICEIVDELQMPPSSDFEKEILNLPSNEVRITDFDLEQLQLFSKRLVQQLKNVRAEISELRDKIEGLWDKLGTDIVHRESFRRENLGHSLVVLKNLKIELKKLEDIRKTKIQSFITKEREELIRLWEKCHCPEVEKESFIFFKSDRYTEELLELHENEISRLKKYHHDNKDIFVLLQEYQKLLDELKSLELGSMNRLFNNRGGRLLEEERTRNKLYKRIPKIEENLVKLAETFSVNQGQQFRTFGQTIQEFIAKTHDDMKKEFKIILSGQKQKRDYALKSSNSRRNQLFPQAGTSSSRPPSPSSDSTKKVLSAQTSASKQIKSAFENKHTKSGAPKVQGSKIRRLSKKIEQKHRMSLSTKPSGKANKKHHEESDSTSYDEFEDEVSTKSTNCRSTGYVIKDSNRSFKIPLVLVSDTNGAVIPQ